MALFDKTKLVKPVETPVTRHLVMVVDDEPANLKVLCSLLEGEFEVTVAHDGLEALRIIESLENPDRLRLVISDQRMPNMTGTALFEKLCVLMPKTIRILLTGYADLNAIMDCINKAQIYRYICKPFDREDILLTVRRSLELQELQAAKIAAEEESKRHLERVNEVLSSTNRLKDLFLATVSHELRTPMHGVVGNLDLLHAVSLNDEARSWLSDATDSAKQMGGMLDEILGYTEIQTGTLKLKPGLFSLRAMIESLADSAQRSCEQKGLIFQCEMSTELPLRIVSDQERLTQILQHLISNAVKFTDSGKVVLRVAKVEPRSGFTAALHFQVLDSGPGISAEQQETLFESFRQLNQQFNRRHGGMGLGLAICKQLAHLFNAQLEVTSTAGEGCCFSLTLPIEIGQDEFVSTAAPTESTSLCRCKVLVVDDNPVNRKVILAMLARLGYQTSSAGNGIEALDVAAQDNFDIILMDCQMPVMDGFEATQRLKNSERYADIPIIAVTANASQNDRERAQASGMCDLLKKPVTLAQLSECLLSWR